MSIKDIIGIAVVSMVFFPVVLMVMMFATGVARIDFGLDGETKAKANTYLRKYNPIQDEAEVKQMKTFEALNKKEEEIKDQQAELNREIERLELLKNENAKLKEAISKDKNDLEKLVAQSSDIKQKRIEALAEVYGTMRPEEAAPILLTMSDKMVADIMRLIPEVRSKSKLMGALGTMDVKRAARISKLMGETENNS